MKKTVYLVLALGVFGGCAGDVWCGYSRFNGAPPKSNTRRALGRLPVNAQTYCARPVHFTLQKIQQINALYDTAKDEENRYRVDGNQEKNASKVRNAYKAVYAQIPGDTIDAKLQKASEELKGEAYIIWNSVFKVASYDKQTDIICRLFSTFADDAQRKHLEDVVKTYFSADVGAYVQPFTKPTEAESLVALRSGVFSNSASFLGRQILNSDKQGTGKFQDALPFFEIKKNSDKGASVLLEIATIKGLLDTTDDEMNGAVNEAVGRLVDLQAAANSDKDSAHMLDISLSSISAVSDFKVRLGDVCYEYNAFLSDAPNKDPESRYQAMMYHAVASLIERCGNQEKAKAVRAAHADLIREVGYIPGLCSLLWDGNDRDIGALEKDETSIDVTDMFLRGGIFQYGNNPDIDKAIKWYEKAADVGHPQAQYNLGWIYENDATHRDIKKSIHWYERAANAEYQHAQYHLGLIYEDDKNIDAAIKWYEKAANAGHQHAQHNLGWIYDNKDDATHRDIKKSIYWYAQVLQHKENPSLKQRAKNVLYFLWNRISFNDTQYSYTGKGRTQAQFTFEDTADLLPCLAQNQIVEKVNAHYMINVGGAIHFWLQRLKDGNLSASERNDLISKLQYRLKFTTQLKYRETVECQYRHLFDDWVVYSANFNLNEDQLKTLNRIGITPNETGRFQYKGAKGGTATDFKGRRT